MQRQSILNYFRISSKEGMEAFAVPLSILFKRTKNSLKTSVDKESQHPVIVVTLDADPGSGKSTLSKQLLWRISEGYEDSDGCELSFFNSDSTSLAWQSYWNKDQGFDNRVFDSLLEGPFLLSDNARGDDKAPSPPKRNASGFDLIEHSYAVPHSIIAVKIDIEILDNGDRLVRVAIPDASPSQKQEFEDFTEYVSSLEL